MAKINLPVILLDSILLPNNEIRLDFSDEVNKIILDEALLFHDNKVLVAYQLNDLEEVIDVNDLPSIGTIAKVTNKIDLPNNAKRVTLKGLERALVNEYLHQNDGTYESIVSSIEQEPLEEEIEVALINKIKKEVKDYVSLPNVSNGILSKITDCNSLYMITDIVVPSLQLENDRIFQYLNCYSALKRTEMLLEDIYKLKELFNIENKLDVKVKNTIDDDQKEFYLKEKMKVIREELGEISPKSEIIEELNNSLKKLNANETVKNKIKYEIDRYEQLSENSPELGLVRSYIDLALSLPWNTKTKKEQVLSNVRKKLDATHYGLDEVKNRVIEHLAVLKLTHKSTGSIICLVGPSGCGKTTLASSIADSINSNFTKISVGGLNDAAEILGHRQTYLGANAGRIIEGITRAKSSNPVFLIDEVDKMSKDFKGDPAAALLEVLDNSQNKTFKDNYLRLEYDLSDVMFILTANNEEDIPYALRDRLEIIHINGYTDYEKIDIARNYIIPKLANEYNINLNIDDNSIKKIITDYTKEAGVRELERLLRKLFRKVITNMVLKDAKEGNKKITLNNIEDYLGKYEVKKFNYNSNIKGVANSLAYTELGGITLPIEVIYMPGNGNLILTGSMSETMQESAKVALSYVKSNYEYFNIDKKIFLNNDIHIHIPSSMKKDGISAGMTIVTAIISSFTNMVIPNNIGFTGEVSLTGIILKIAGLKEKSSGAYVNGINKIFIPYDNQNDIKNIDNEIIKNIEFIPVKEYKEIYEYLKGV